MPPKPIDYRNKEMLFLEMRFPNGKKMHFATMPFCEWCMKPFNTKHGVATHEGKMHPIQAALRMAVKNNPKRSGS
jgi:hypothetical protein